MRRCLFSFLVLLLLAAAMLGRPDGRAAAQGNDDFLWQAVALANTVQRETGIPSSVIVAQAILESGWGRKPVAEAKNYFGMKAFEKADGSINIGPIAAGWAWAWTSEWDGGQYVSQRERFRTYASMADSFRDLGHLYSQNDRYAAAMRQTGDPRQFAREIAAAGYATTPGYGDKLIQLMDSQNLYQYDLKTDDARFIDQSDYLTLSPGASFQIYFELRNSGANVWRAHDGYSLRNDNAQVMGAARQQELADDIPPEDSVRWTIPMTAPLEPGRYRTEWRMYHGDTPFGPELYIEVTVQEQPPPVISRDFASPALVLLLASALLGGLSSYLLLVRHIKTSKA